MYLKFFPGKIKVNKNKINLNLLVCLTCSIFTSEAFTWLCKINVQQVYLNIGKDNK